MKICVVGTGYVGLVTGACFADVGNEVICVDKDVSKVECLRRGEIPIYEPGLEEVVKRNIHENRISFVTDLSKGLAGSAVCFITVDTPPLGDGSADLKNVLAVAEEIGGLISSYTIIVTKSTVPVGTTMKVKGVISERLAGRSLDPEKMFDVASNPEFLKEGDAVNDFMKPYRVVVGVEKDSVGKILHSLYAPFMLRKDRYIQVDIPTSELTKYASNAMLATRISFMNELSRLCEKVGANICDVRRGMGSDPRIGPDFLYAGLGYGGSCFPKDVKAIVRLGHEYDERLSILEAVDNANEKQREWFLSKIVNHFEKSGGFKDASVAVWGLSFKANTDDVRHAPSLYLLDNLVKRGIKVRVFDPVATDNAKQMLEHIAHKVEWHENCYDCLHGADALVVCTEWREFRSPDFERMKKSMNDGAIIFDGRNIYDIDHVSSCGFKIQRIG